MRKNASKFLLLLSACAVCILLLPACQKEPPVEDPDKETVSATDPLPFPFDENKDLSAQPGDDFWQYCNGRWNANTPTPATDAVGGLYDATPVIKEMEQNLVNQDPSLKHFYELKDNLYANAAAAEAYLTAMMASYPDVQDLETAYRTVGRLIMDGMPFANMTLVNDYKDGKIIGVLGGTGETYKYALSDLDPSVQTYARWVAEGMGMNPENLYFSGTAPLLLSGMSTAPIEEIAKIIKRSWTQYFPYVSAELNASLGDGAWTPEYTREMARALLGYEMSHRFAQKYVSKDLKQYYVDLSYRLIDAFRERIKQLDWMSETTRKNALDKLDKMLVFVGCPDTWYEDCLPDLSKCQSLVEAIHKLKVANILLLKHLIGTQDVFTNSLTMIVQQTPGHLVVTDLTLVNAFYRREYNCFVILPAVILQPAMRSDVSEAHTYGLMAAAAHEITHGFDSEGARYDAVGRLRNWWTVADNMAFKERQEQLITCFNLLEYDPVGHPGQFTDGQRTLTENIADLGGMHIARDAYIKRLHEQGFSGENFNAQLRKFYESYANGWCIKYSEEKLAFILSADIHSHCRLRVNGIVMNSDMWYELYDVTRDNILYLPPEKRTYIW
ncbi:MAG: M13 family metallopeptidase [Bacteroidales bacterium]|nr:M13 family metallopeptidase [Bacteroidales bacterium]